MTSSKIHDKNEVVKGPTKFLVVPQLGYFV